MNCPICGSEMCEGGLVFGGYSPCWVDKKQLTKTCIMDSKHELVAKSNYLIRQTKVENAYFCEKCNKVTGIFDVRPGNKQSNKTEE